MNDDQNTIAELKKQLAEAKADNAQYRADFREQEKRIQRVHKELAQITGEAIIKRELLTRAEAERDTLRAEVERLVDALRPFAHDDLQSELGGNVQGDSSPVYGRNRATLTLGDFRKARAAIDAARTP